MKNAMLTDKKELIIVPSATSAATDFDFLVGTHNVHHVKRKLRLQNNEEWIAFTGTHRQELILNGIGNLEQHQMITPEGKSVAGIALRLFNPARKLWSIYWSDSNSGILDVPMIGSFENNIGCFFSKDTYENIPILVQFKWDATDRNKPVWSQGFSTDDGKTWEWNWHMYFTKTPAANELLTDTATTSVEDDRIDVIELRNYLLKPQKRDAFISYFETNFILSQEKLKGYPLGQYRIKDNPDNFCWIRGFSSMQTRSAFLPAFYYSDFWKQHRTTTNSMIVNNDNVHLLCPLSWQSDSLMAGKGIKKELLYPKKRIAIVDFYTANNKLEQLKKLIAKQYLPILNTCGIYSFTLWQAELRENDFPKLPVFQDKNLLVIITFYNNEQEYIEKMKVVESKTGENLKAALLDTITSKQSMILYPTDDTMKN
jgi:hypothetical protein